MVPSYVIQLETMPISAAGKLDLRALPVSTQQTDEDNFVAPTTPKEKELAKIFQEVLGIERVGVSDNFFELGGDSIISINVISKCRKGRILFLI